MQDTTENALVEISLALAMAFFALLIVALVAVGTPLRADALADAAEAVEEPAPAPPEVDLDADGEGDVAQGEPRYLFVLDGRWYDEAARAFEPAQLAADGRRLVVALPPDVTLVDAQHAQAQLAHLSASVTLTTMPEDWRRRLVAR